MKRKYIDDSKLVLKIVSALKGGNLITGIYDLASSTPYKDRVDNKLLRSTVSKLK
jgi:hypothetical protein